jgi:hypothetical protein
MSFWGELPDVVAVVEGHAAHKVMPTPQMAGVGSTSLGIRERRGGAAEGDEILGWSKLRKWDAGSEDGGSNDESAGEQNRCPARFSCGVRSVQASGVAWVLMGWQMGGCRE